MEQLTYTAQRTNLHESEDRLKIAERLNFLFENRGLIGAALLAALLLGALYAIAAKPIYRTGVLLQVQDPAPSKDTPVDIRGIFEIKTTASTEIEIIRSGLVLSRTVEALGLNVSAQPLHFPILGQWAARQNTGLSEPGVFGLGGYLWGSEKLHLSVFNMPEHLEGQEFRLTATGGGNYQLTNEGAFIKISGRAGEIVRKQIEGGEIVLKVDQLHSKPGGQFRLKRIATSRIVQGLQNDLQITERGKQSGIIEVKLEGTDPAATAKILNEIGDQYVRQNVERRTEEAMKSLAFLNKQLPELKEELNRSETSYNQLRNVRSTVDLAEEARGMLQQSASAQTRLEELKRERQTSLLRFQPVHPVIKGIDEQISLVNQQLAQYEQKIKTMPNLEQDVLRLTRDIKVNTELYTGLLNTAQQMRLVKESQVGTVRLLDRASKPLEAVKPQRFLLVLASIVMGLIAGILAAVIRKKLNGAIDDPYMLEDRLGVSVKATVPHSARQVELYEHNHAKTGALSILAEDSPSEHAVDSLRSLRTSLHFETTTAKNNIIMITGPTPGVGKSFIAANFAAVLASNGKRVLLIDADLKKGYLHLYFGRMRIKGLAEIISGSSIIESTQKNMIRGVDFISTGQISQVISAELLAHPNFGNFLHEVSSQYDWVLIDTAPVLAAADAAIIGTHVGTVFNVVRSKVTSLGEIEEAIRRLNQARAPVSNLIFNDLEPAAVKYGAKIGKYRYAEYSY